MKQTKEVISGAIVVEWSGILPDGAGKPEPLDDGPTRDEVSEMYAETIQDFRNNKIGMVLVITEKGEYGIGESQEMAVEEMDERHPGTKDKRAYFFYS